MFVLPNTQGPVTWDHFKVWAWSFSDFRSQTFRAHQWLWIQGWWWFIPLHPEPKLNQARFLAAHFSVVAQLDSSLSEPQALCPVAPLLVASGLQSLTELSWQKQALVLAHLTGVLFPFHFWRFADALYFPVNSVTHLKRYLFNTTLHCFLHFVQHLVF